MRTLKIYLLGIIAVSTTAFAKPAPPIKPQRVHHNAPVQHHAHSHITPPRPMYGPRLPPPPPKHHHSHHNSFLPGFVGGLLGSVLIPQPTVVVQPVQITIWVEGRYVDQVQPNGVVIRVWQPGHYETIVQ